MTDIISELRKLYQECQIHNLRLAEEIERLRAENERLREALTDKEGE